jgi:hypothetical protein
VLDGLLQLIEGDKAAIEKRTRIDRGLDPPRVTIEQITLSAYSISAIAFDMAGWDTESCAAAFPMLPQLATVSKTWRSRNFRRRLRRCSSQSMAVPMNLSYGFIEQ